MILSNFGKIVDTEWHKSFIIRNELFLNEYIIMPNHLHAIVELKNKCDRTNLDFDHGNDFDRTNDLYPASVETHGRASLPCDPSIPSITSITSIPNSPNKKPLIRKPKSISSFIAGFKSAINSKIDDHIDKHNLNILKYNKNNHFFQPNYHDHIIRNDKSHQTISKYIINNPLKWNDDTFNSSKKNYK